MFSFSSGSRKHLGYEPVDGSFCTPFKTKPTKTYLLRSLSMLDSELAYPRGTKALGLVHETIIPYVKYQRRHWTCRQGYWRVATQAVLCTTSGHHSHITSWQTFSRTDRWLILYALWVILSLLQLLNAALNNTNQQDKINKRIHMLMPLQFCLWILKPCSETYCF